MALQKDYLTKYNVTGNYWRVIDIELNPKTGNDKLIVCMYKDLLSREASKAPLTIKEYIFPIILDIETDEVIKSPFTVKALDANNPYVIAYTWLKTQDFFSGSLDV